jgi:hypothetical protein
MQIHFATDGAMSTSLNQMNTDKKCIELNPIRVHLI